jgi:hypothetical protein
MNILLMWMIGGQYQLTEMLQEQGGAGTSGTTPDRNTGTSNSGQTQGLGANMVM